MRTPVNMSIILLALATCIAAAPRPEIAHAPYTNGQSGSCLPDLRFSLLLDLSSDDTPNANQ